MVQPTPMSRRLAPVMLARASEQGDSSAPHRCGATGAPESSKALPPLHGEHEVDDVLGQHGDERQYGDGQAGRDVELGHLGRPRQQEGGADDGQAEEQRGDRVAQVDVGDADEHAGHHHEDREDQRESLAAGLYMAVQVLVDRGHGRGS